MRYRAMVNDPLTDHDMPINVRIDEQATGAGKEVKIRGYAEYEWQPEPKAIDDFVAVGIRRDPSIHGRRIVR